jgi:uncharacterized metal-binding protein YceD (DUF177 family)
MAIKVKDIPPEGMTLEFDQKLDLLDTGSASTAFRAVVNIKPAGGGSLHLSGRVHSAPELECSRCLKRFPFTLDTGFSIDVSPLSTMDKSPEHELLGGELETEFYQGDEIDPLDFVKEQLLISIPMVPVHSPDCKGLCPACGADLNSGECGCRREGPGGFGPFSDLKDLFKKKE